MDNGLNATLWAFYSNVTRALATGAPRSLRTRRVGTGSTWLPATPPIDVGVSATSCVGAGAIGLRARSQPVNPPTTTAYVANVTSDARIRFRDIMDSLV